MATEEHYSNHYVKPISNSETQHSQAILDVEGRRATRIRGEALTEEAIIFTIFISMTNGCHPLYSENTPLEATCDYLR